NDEYHVPVPLPDIWAEYKRLKTEEGWTQECIAQAKGVGEADVSDRLRFAALPAQVQDAFFETAVLKERHARELLKVSNFELSPWLTRDEVLCEIVATVLDKTRGASVEKVPTAGVFRKYVRAYNDLVTEAQKAIDSFLKPFHTVEGHLYNPRCSFLGTL